jgi:hypothetical protein
MIGAPGPAWCALWRCPLSPPAADSPGGPVVQGGLCLGPDSPLKARFSPGVLCGYWFRCLVVSV